MAEGGCPVDPKTREVWMKQAQQQRDQADSGSGPTCPVHKSTPGEMREGPVEAVGEGFSWRNLFWAPTTSAGTRSPSSGGQSSGAVCPVTQKSGGGSAMPEGHPPVPEGGSCPVSPEARNVWLKAGEQAKKQSLSTKTTAAVNEAVESCSSDTLDESLSNIMMDDAVVPGDLADERQVSSIPRTGEDSNWVYPSEKQFYKAMKRKQWEPEADDMKTVVPLHNMVNEVAWNYIQDWEHGQGGEKCGGIKLTSFKGNAHQTTPRAWIGHYIFGRDLPFDRHDWTVNRCGKKVDYVIDFYSRVPSNSTEPTFYLDVRPKLNTVEGWRLRVERAISGRKE